MDWGKKWLGDFNTWKTQLVSSDQFNNAGSIDVKMDESILKEKSSFKMLELTFSSQLDWGLLLYSIAKTASNETGALIRSRKFLSPGVPLYVYKSTIHHVWNVCHVWAGVLSCYMELLQKLQKQLCWTAGPSRAASPEPLAHCRNVARLSLF